MDLVAGGPKGSSGLFTALGRSWTRGTATSDDSGHSSDDCL